MDNNILAPEWKWSTLYGYRKVLREKSSYLRLKNDKIVYVPGRNTGIHGEWDMDYNNKLPYIKLAVLTYHEKEIQEEIEGQLR